eukprot:gene9452-12736_t
MNSLTDLTEENHAQLRKYLKFFRQKKDGIVRAIELEFTDAKNDRLNENMYTKEDVQEYSDFLASATRSQVSADISAIINMGALAISQLFETAQMKGVDLALETAPLENQALLEAVEKMSLDALPKNPRRGVELSSFKEEAKNMRDATGRLEETNARLQAEVASLRKRLQTAERKNESIAEGKSEDVAMMRELEYALEGAKEENTKRVAETTQFQQMRKLMQSQSEKIRDLRMRLQRYEPDDSLKEEDDA